MKQFIFGTFLIKLKVGQNLDKQDWYHLELFIHFDLDLFGALGLVFKKRTCHVGCLKYSALNLNKRVGGIPVSIAK